MNDINILTFWGVPNYGTFAQAYALQASIQKAYPEYDVKQINYLCQKHYKQYYSKYPIDPIWKKNFYKSLGKYLNPFSDYHKRRKNFPKDYNSIPHTEQFTASQLSLYEMDCLVLGSDIIWDYSFAFFDNDPYLFGNGLKAKKKVAYACSFGTVSNHDKHPEYVIDGIKGLDYISVRDENSADIVEVITGIRSPVVLDPTWLWDFSDDNNIIKPKFDNYIIVYGVLFTKEFINQTIEYSHEKGYKLICLACNDDKYDWCDVLIQQSELSVFEWLGLFKYAEKVVTSTYHGLMFGLIFNKPLAFCKSDFIVAKAESFLKKIGLYDLYVTECSSVERMLGLEWDYQTINHIIEIERNKSMLFLRKALKGE